MEHGVSDNSDLLYDFRPFSSSFQGVGILGVRFSAEKLDRTVGGPGQKKSGQALMRRPWAGSLVQKMGASH